jgi:hypothetical protein
MVQEDDKQREVVIPHKDYILIEKQDSKIIITQEGDYGEEDHVISVLLEDVPTLIAALQEYSHQA